mmetsp:Transcript_6074/g.17042  ORF Transcript_6074/g.17042 Transcript_6074/m.17042 type:complete len:343 (-) Transcript_6074:1990-3018(-)
MTEAYATAMDGQHSQQHLADSKCDSVQTTLRRPIREEESSSQQQQQQQQHQAMHNNSVFVHVAQGDRHSIGITANGQAYSWGKSNALGQLGRDCGDGGNSSSTTATSSTHQPQRAKQPAAIPNLPFAVRRAFVSQGGTDSKDSGHSAVVDASGTKLWMTGCDRWQQLGLGSAQGGSSGYTWKHGKLWQTQFTPSRYVVELMQKQQGGACSIRDVALGGDHTLVLSSNQRDVYAFGKGAEGQLGLTQKPYVSAPVKSTQLSVSASSNGNKIAALCAVDACSMTLRANGMIHKQVGKCPARGELAANLATGLGRCVAQAENEGLIDTSKSISKTNEAIKVTSPP